MSYPGMPGLTWNAGARTFMYADPNAPGSFSGGVFDAIPATSGDIESGSDIESGADCVLVGADGNVYDSAGNYMGAFESGAAPALFSGAAPALFSGATAFEALANATGADYDSGADSVLVDTGATDITTGARIMRRVAVPRGARGARGNFRTLPRTAAPAGAQPAAPRTVVMSKPLRERKANLGLDATGIAAGAIASITKRPQVKNWQGYQLVVPQSIASDWLILGVFVEQRNCFADGTPQPGEGYTSTNDEPNIDMPVNTNGLDVIVQVQNVSGVAGKTFRGILRGKVVTNSSVF